ncbi:Spondin-1 [Liparis tanakae]|uniref:Spondin-1 n=1 Tax=Liparis tanakae TaxID=230148 RepID=A0A4Z2I7D7_9TELE|nr:Spondin-1 [Liparis tanakae]
MGMYLHVLFLLCYFVSSFVCNAVSFVEEPAGGRLDGYCGRILRAQTQGTRRDGHNEFRLRVEGDPETYQPGTTYRVVLMATSPAYFRGFTLIALKEGREGTTDDDYTGQFQNIDAEDTQFMTNCAPAVTESTPRRRTRIQVFWTAPPTGSGCVILKKVSLDRSTGSLNSSPVGSYLHHFVLLEVGFPPLRCCLLLQSGTLVMEDGKSDRMKSHTAAYVGAPVWGASEYHGSAVQAPQGAHKRRPPTWR